MHVHLMIYWIWMYVPISMTFYLLDTNIIGIYAIFMRNAILRVKKVKSSWGVLMGCSSPLLRSWARMCINHLSLWRMASATPDLHLPSQSQDTAARDWYQIILLGDRGTCVWTTCPRSLPDSGTAGSWTGDLSSRLGKLCVHALNWPN